VTTTTIIPLDLEIQSSGQKQFITPVVIQDEQDIILVDCGYPDSVTLIEEALYRHSLSIGQLTKLIVTHHDLDHIGSLAALKRANPQLSIIALDFEVPYLEGSKKSLRLQQAESTLDQLPEAAKAQAQQFIAYLQTIEPAHVDLSVKPAEKLPWCGGIEIVHTPGHMPGHISLYLPASRTMIAGDAVVIQEDKLAIANPQFTLDMTEAVRSVERLLSYEIDRLICYHGGVFQGQVKHALEQLLAMQHE